jgi:hypothetical protein
MLFRIVICAMTTHTTTRATKWIRHFTSTTVLLEYMHKYTWINEVYVSACAWTATVIKSYTPIRVLWFPTRPVEAIVWCTITSWYYCAFYDQSTTYVFYKDTVEGLEALCPAMIIDVANYHLCFWCNNVFLAVCCTCSLHAWCAFRACSFSSPLRPSNSIKPALPLPKARCRRRNMS